MRGPLVKSTKNKEKLPATTPKVWGKGPVRIYDSVSGASLYRGYVRQRTLSDGIKHLDKPTDSRHYSDMSAVDTVPISAKDAAQKVLDTVWKDRPFPVDPVWLAAQFGIKVVETDLPEEVSGAIIKNKDKDPVIALSNSDHKNRKRFSCAHELGHYAFRMDAGEEEYGYVDFRGKAAGMGTAPEEIFANQFAAALLMPEDEVRRLWKEKTPPFLMAQYFGVSDDAMNFRLENLKLAA